MAMTWWQALILGIIQGLAEFLPISSSGHLALFKEILNIEEVPRFFDICLHLGTLATVFIVFRDDIISLIRKPKQKLNYLILIVTIPTVIIAVLFEKLLPADFTAHFLGYGFMITGILLYAVEIMPKALTKRDVNGIRYRDGILIGSLQGVATLAGISRSGATIAGGIFTGIDRELLSSLSFLLSIPAITGAFLWDTAKLITKGTGGDIPVPWYCVIIGVVSAFVVGYLAINYMLKLIKSKSFKPFAFYTFILGFAICLDKFLFNIVF